MGFEPTRAEPIGLAVQRLNHSATSSCTVFYDIRISQIKPTPMSGFEFRFWVEDRYSSIVDNHLSHLNTCQNISRLEKIASAGNRTRINCLEGSYADHYTTDALIESMLTFEVIMTKTMIGRCRDPPLYWNLIRTPWRNGSASDSRSEGCVFESRRGQTFKLSKVCH